MNEVLLLNVQQNVWIKFSEGCCEGIIDRFFQLLVMEVFCECVFFLSSAPTESKKKCLSSSLSSANWMSFRGVKIIGDMTKTVISKKK